MTSITKFRPLDTVSSEGGPLLIADAATAQNWRCFDEDKNEGGDYQLACDALNAAPTLPGLELQISVSRFVVWEMGGSGTANVLRISGSEIMIVRTWLDEGNGLPTILELAALPVRKRHHFADLTVHCGVLAILWAPESGTCIETSDILEIEDFQEPSGDIAISGSSLLVKLSNGNYSLFHDEVELASDESALRCHIELSKTR